MLLEEEAGSQHSCALKYALDCETTLETQKANGSRPITVSSYEF